MDKLQKKWNRNYASLVLNSKNMVTTAGRYASDKQKLTAVFQDIITKLSPKAHSRVLDIGCGYGTITKKLIQLARNKKFELSLIDIPEMIDAVRRDLIVGSAKSIRLMAGTFPDDFRSLSKQFDRILIYSVIHYTLWPERLIDAAVKRLAPRGRCLIGDIPNLSRKGRFLSSRFGRQFDANYKNVPLKAVPQYENHHEFLKMNAKNPLRILNDDFVSRLFKKYRDQGFDVFVLPQPSTLPFSFTREDVLICRHD